MVAGSLTISCSESGIIDKQPDKRVAFLWHGLLLLCGIAIALYVMTSTEIGRAMKDEAWIRAQLEAFGPWGAGIFMALVAILSAIGFSKHIVSAVAGYLYGLTMGTLLTTIGSVLGCMLAFYYARHFGRDWVVARISGRLKALDTMFRDHAFMVTLVVRWFPISGNLFSNLLGGVSAAPALPFAMATFVAQLPLIFVFCLLGSGVHSDMWLRFTLSAILFCLSSLAILVLMKNSALTATYRAILASEQTTASK